ncbi:MAG: hypothetical protein HY722_13115, partial [Planctomycetes bacterium]|nr:hypothetical protein [Planctomycetota bacterium]
ELARYLPNVRSIRVLEREELSAGPRLHNLWEAEARIPRVAAAFIKPNRAHGRAHAVADPGGRKGGTTAADARVA